MSPITSTEARAGSRTSLLNPAEHFRLAVMAAALRVRQIVLSEGALNEFPFLDDYAEEAAEICGVPAGSQNLLTCFQAEIRLQNGEPTLLPLERLAGAADLDQVALILLLTIGLIEEDPRFGALFEWAHPNCPGQQRPTRGLLTAWWRSAEDCSSVRIALARLSELGLINVVNPESPRLQWAYEPNAPLWDVLRGELVIRGISGLSFHPPAKLPSLHDFMVPDNIAQKLKTVPNLLSGGQASAVLVRGPLHNGRKTLLRALARSCRCGVIEVEPGSKLDSIKSACLGTLCILLHAWPVFTFELGPGETASVPSLGVYDGPHMFAISRHGNLQGTSTERCLNLELPLPARNVRRGIWAQALRVGEDAVPDWADGFRLTSGGILRSAELARTQALLDATPAIDGGHIRRGLRALQQPLENLARRVEENATWSDMVAAPDVLGDLQTLLNRCRFREQLAGVAGPAISNCGVKALLGGPSGTGKTLAARVIASELGLDLYRLDLSGIVNKYIGETEKNLNEMFSRAEELNVVVLLDEGDSLLAGRTAVQSSNDRYANLETDFLLQRIDTFEGIVLITTNALQRIDHAFLRRMDVLVEFRMPDAEQRRQIWRLHLPPGHQVSEAWLEDVARRCSLSGGQIRNAALHTSLLALARNSHVSTEHATAAVLREYQKIGAVCPLRRAEGR